MTTQAQSVWTTSQDTAGSYRRCPALPAPGSGATGRAGGAILSAVLHTRLVVHRLELDGAEVALRHGTLVAVARAETHRTDWEVVADCVQESTLGLGRVAVEMLCITGARDDGDLLLGVFTGEAVVVRVVDRTIVLRGDGPLEGLGIDQLQG
jgi:hypothetical protein